MINELSKITFCTGVGTVTGANFLLESPTGSKILIDCGLVQGEKVANEENREPFSYDLSQIDALVITHAHLDHVGRIPKLVKDGYKGPIYSTPETRALAELVLDDSVSLLDKEARRDGLVPLYDAEDVARVFPLWKIIPYHQSIKLTDDVSIYLKDAGHILGSSMVEVTVGGISNNIVNENMSGQMKMGVAKPVVIGGMANAPSAMSVMGTTPATGTTKILFTGDLGNSPAPLLRDTEPVGEVDYLVMESVYGDRNHEGRDMRDDKFCDIINKTMARGGTLVIPVFAIDRTQVILYELNNMVEQKKIPSVPIFVDSPMATEATRVYAGSTQLFNEKVLAQITGGDDVLSFPRLKFTVSPDQSRGIDHVQGAKIILAGSGMSIGGRVIGHEETYLPDPKNTILLVGYQSPGSIGRQLFDGAKKIKIHDRKIHVKAEIDVIDGYSAHKDGDHLVEFVAGAEKLPKKVFVVMGEPGASMHLAQRINDELGGNAIVPDRGLEYVLE
jgi:metallo-beta-lactamase family protein